MTSFDLDSMPLEDLLKLQKSVHKAVESYKDRQRQNALIAAEATVREMGFSLAELTGLPARKIGAVMPAKYRDSHNSNNTWTGRGRQPIWLKSAIEAGQSKDDFLIEK